MSDEDRFLVSGWEDDLHNIDEEKSPHETPDKEILWAAENGNLDVIKKILEIDSSLINVVDNDGYTPLHRASYANHVDIVSYLLESGANVSAQTEMLWQPLHSACQWNNTQCALYLIQNGADVNATSEGGQTPLHIAASHGTSYATVQLLLMDPNIKPHLKNNNNETAYDIAKRNSRYYHIFEMAMPEIQGMD